MLEMDRAQMPHAQGHIYPLPTAFERGNPAAVMRDRPDTRLIRAIRDYLERTGTSPRALSLRLGRNETFIRRILDGTVGTPRGDHLAHLAQAIGARAEDLVEDRGRARKSPESTQRLPHPSSSLAELWRAQASESIAAAGPRLRATRLALGFRTTDQLAAEIGATAEEVTGWEEGLLPDLAALAVLKLRRDVPLDWLLLGDDRSLPPLLLHALTEAGAARRLGGAPRGLLPEAPEPVRRTIHEEQSPARDGDA